MGIKLEIKYVMILILTIIVIGPKLAMAGGFEVIGNSAGLVVEPEDTRLFDMGNMNPGDEVTSSILVKNRYIKPFNLYLRVERIGEAPKTDAPDLYDKLIMTIKQGTDQLYSGSIIPSLPIEIGSFTPGDVANLDISVSLPGSDTSNEYQGMQVDTEWIFIAQLHDGVDPDEPPSDPIHSKPPAGPEEPAKPEKPGDDDDDFIDIDDEEIPAGPIVEDNLEDKREEGHDKEGDNSQKIEDVGISDNEEDPKGKITMPKTGESIPYALYSVGVGLIILGLIIGRDRKLK